MIELLVKIGIVMLVMVIIFVFPSKTRTWFKGHGACDFSGLYCCRKAMPRSDCKLLDDVEWYCDKHYDEKMNIRKMVDAEYGRESHSFEDVDRK